MGADPLSDVLNRVRLTGATFFDIKAAGSWVAEQAPRNEVLPIVLPGAGHLISYHAVTKGTCYASLIGGEPIRLEEGDIIVFTHGDPHVMASGPGMRADRSQGISLDGVSRNQLPFSIHYGEQAEPAVKLVCGFLACDAQPFNPLLTSLPQVMVAARDADYRDDGLDMFVQLAMRESAARESGGESILAKLSELMFIAVVRRYLQSLPEAQGGWLAGLSDPCVGGALALMHADVAKDWTMDDMAREVGVSRSVLFARFSQLVGMPPMQYLARWRMQVAAGLLKQGDATLAGIAAAVGYASEEAFSRAFKKVVGESPSEWRRTSQRQPGSPV